jgi:hypothetical protein
MLACKLINGFHSSGSIQGNLKLELAGVMVSILGHLIDPPPAWQMLP